MAASQCLGQKRSRYDARKVARIGASLEDSAHGEFRHGLEPRCFAGKMGFESALELGQKKQTVSCCARRNFNKFAEGVRLRKLAADLMSFWVIKDLGLDAALLELCSRSQVSSVKLVREKVQDAVIGKLEAWESKGRGAWRFSQRLE